MISHKVSAETYACALHAQSSRRGTLICQGVSPFKLLGVQRSSLGALEKGSWTGRDSPTDKTTDSPWRWGGGHVPVPYRVVLFRVDSLWAKRPLSPDPAQLCRDRGGQSSNRHPWAGGGEDGAATTLTTTETLPLATTVASSSSFLFKLRPLGKGSSP